MTNSDQNQLPACDYRTVIDGQDYYICRHNRVRTNNGQVCAEICMRCSVRLLPEIPIDAYQKTYTPPPRSPNLAKRAWNLAVAVKDFVADGCQTISAEQFETRLAICDECEFRKDNSCTKCGCRLLLKARGRAFSCPVGKWPAIGRKKLQKRDTKSEE